VQLPWYAAGNPKAAAASAAWWALAGSTAQPSSNPFGSLPALMSSVAAPPGVPLAGPGIQGAAGGVHVHLPLP